MGHSCQVGKDTFAVDGFAEYVEKGLIPREMMHIHDFNDGPFLPLQAYDLCWCSEFVEHVDEKYAANFLETFRACRHLCLTYATPGQGGYHHVNENTLEYWVKRLDEFGFTHDAEETKAMRATGPDIGYGRRTLTWFNNRERT